MACAGRHALSLASSSKTASRRTLRMERCGKGLLMLRRAKRLVQTLAELRRLLDDGTQELVVILATAKRVAFEVAELALLLYALWLIIGRR